MAVINLGKLVYLWRGDYSAAQTYARYDTCRYQDKVYICVADALVNEDPVATPANWDLMTEGASSLTTGGDILYHDGTIVNRLPAGTDGEALVMSGGMPAWTAPVGGGLKSVQVFNASGTWTKPAGIALVKVFVTGGGGGGGDGSTTNYVSAGGGGGGTAIKYVDVSAVSSLTVTIGAAGAGGAGGGSGGNGGTSSFGALCSATGGTGGGANFSTTSASGGIGSSGDMNLDGARGGVGASAQTHGTGGGGGSFWSPTMSPGRGTTQYETPSPVAGTYGRGGQGNTNNDGGAGGAGVVVVEEYG